MVPGYPNARASVVRSSRSTSVSLSSAARVLSTAVAEAGSLPAR